MAADAVRPKMAGHTTIKINNTIVDVTFTSTYDSSKVLQKDNSLMGCINDSADFVRKQVHNGRYNFGLNYCPNVVCLNNETEQQMLLFHQYLHNLDSVGLRSQICPRNRHRNHSHTSPENQRMFSIHPWYSGCREICGSPYFLPVRFLLS